MTGIQALLGFAAWTLALVVPQLIWRLIEVTAGGKRFDSWTRGRAIASPAILTRFEHAHLNCLENLPIFAVIVIAAIALDRSAVLNALAVWILVARIGQTLCHLLGNAPSFVLARGGFYFLQVALFFLLIWNLAN